MVACRYAFEELGLHRLQIAIIPRNRASRRVVEKLAIREEGIALRYLEINGVWEDHVRYAITSEEWDTRRDELLEAWIDVRAATSTGALVVAVLVVAGCSDDDDAAPPADPLPELPVAHLPRSRCRRARGTRRPGTAFAPFPSLGFGIAIPQGWNADPPGRGGLRAAGGRRPGRALLPRRGPQRGGDGCASSTPPASTPRAGSPRSRWTVDDGDEATIDAARAAAEAEVLAAGGTDVNVVETDDGRVRLDFRLEQEVGRRGRAASTPSSAACWCPTTAGCGRSW